MSTGISPDSGLRWKAVLFDVDDTLVDFGASAVAGVRDLLGDILADAGSGLEDGLDEQWVELTEFYYPLFLSGEMTFLDMQLARMSALLSWAGAVVPDRDGLIDLEHRRQEVMTRHYQLFPDVLPTLAAAVHAGLVIGVVSNSDGPHQRAKLAAVGLADTFAAVVISGDLGVAKPEAKIFLAGCRELALEPAEVAYVGDKLDVDALGAAGAGLTGIWLDRLGAANALTVPRSVSVISSLADLPMLWNAPAGSGGAPGSADFSSP